MLDELSVAREKIRRIGVSTSTIAVLAEMSASEVSQFLKGQRPCSNAKAHILNTVATQLETLIQQIAPLPLDLRAPLTLREVFERISDGSLSPMVMHSDGVIGEYSDRMIKWAREE